MKCSSNNPSIQHLALKTQHSTSHPSIQHLALNIQHSPSRFRFIDILRGVAIVVMIAAHASDAFLADTWKHNWAWYNANILFGFVAPGYLFFSGMTLHVALERRGDD